MTLYPEPNQARFETELSPEEVARYARHISLPEIGISGQKKLKSSSVLCIGSGGLGSPLLLYLAAAGVGRIGIIDFDLVEKSNLQRQIIHGTSWIGKPKTTSARAHILEINPSCKVDTFEKMLSPLNALDIIKAYDLVCDCTDNFPSRYLINDACMILKKPNIYGSIDRFEGQVTVFNLYPDSPNFRDLLPEPPPIELIPSCGERGVIGVIPGIIGMIQSMEVIKIITGIGESLNGRLLIIDCLSMKFKELRLIQNIDGPKIDKLIDYEKFCSAKANSPDIKQEDIENISAHELTEIIKSDSQDLILIDVRNSYEANSSSIPGAMMIPLSKIESGEAVEKIRQIASGRKIYVYCRRGFQSVKAVISLKNHGINGVNLIGGIEKWNEIRRED